MSGSVCVDGTSPDPAADAAQQQLPRGQRQEKHGTNHTTVTGGTSIDQSDLGLFQITEYQMLGLVRLLGFFFFFGLT